MGFVSIRYGKMWKCGKDWLGGRRSLETGGMAYQAGLHREAPRLVRKQRELGRNTMKACPGVFVGRNRQGRKRKQTGLRQVRLSIFKRPQECRDDL